MWPKLVVVTVVLVLLSVCTEAQRERGRNRGRDRGERRRPGGNGQRGSGRPGGRRWTGQQYSWQRDLGSDLTATERAYAPANKQVLYQRTSGPALRSQGINKAVTLYDFTGDQPIMMISLRGRRRRGPCLLTDSTFSNYQDIVALVQARNGTTATVTDQLAMDGTGEQMSPTDAQAIMRSSPSSRRICRRGVVIRLRPAGSNPNPSTPTEDVRILTLDRQLTITMPALPDSGRRRGGGRRGQGGRSEGGRPEGGRRGRGRRPERRGRGGRRTGATNLEVVDM